MTESLGLLPPSDSHFMLTSSHVLIESINFTSDSFWFEDYNVLLLSWKVNRMSLLFRFCPTAVMCLNTPWPHDSLAVMEAAVTDDGSLFLVSTDPDPSTGTVWMQPVLAECCLLVGLSRHWLMSV